MALKVYTIGVYGFTEKDFFRGLLHEEIDLFCDVRQRRGVRGSKYAFVNSRRLQQKLSSMDIDYLHIKKLAPTAEIREKQKEIDQKRGIHKKNRTDLDKKFRIEYKRKILDAFDFNKFFKEIEPHYNRIVLFCVEQNPSACHRALAADRMHEIWGVDVIHLLP